MEYKVRTMQINDYPKVYQLWLSIQGFGMRSIDDSQEGIERFIRRNPEMSVVAEIDDEIVGTILCGHDGRRGCFYHVCVAKAHRESGVGKSLVSKAVENLAREHICKVSLIAFLDNQDGNHFWQSLGWNQREDLNYYEYTINSDNQIDFNR